MEWPKKGDRLFKFDKDWYFNASINSINKDFGDIATSYNNAARTLIEAVANERAKVDEVIYPIAFLYRQYLELIIKGITRYGKLIVENEEYYGKYHDLNRLWQDAKSFLHKIYEDMPEETPYVDTCVAEFNEVDPDSIACRYPMTKSGEQTLKGVSYINIRNLYEVMEKLASFFDCLYGDMQNKYDSLNDYRN